MYVCIKIYVRAAAYSLDCHEGAMINCRLCRTFQSLNVNRTETVTSSCRELSVVVSSTVLGQSTRNFVVHIVLGPAVAAEFSGSLLTRKLNRGTPGQKR